MEMKNEMKWKKLKWKLKYLLEVLNKFKLNYFLLLSHFYF